MDNLSIGKKVSQLRRERGMSTTDLARKAGLSQPQVSRLENGRQGFRSATLARIADALGVPESYFFEEEKEKLKVVKQKQGDKRKKLGHELSEDLLSRFGELVVTPGYELMIGRLTAALSREGCDTRTLRRLIDKVLSLSNEERSKLLSRLTSK